MLDTESDTIAAKILITQNEFSRSLSKEFLLVHGHTSEICYLADLNPPNYKSIGMDCVSCHAWPRNRPLYKESEDLLRGSGASLGV